MRNKKINSFTYWTIRVLMIGYPFFKRERKQPLLVPLPKEDAKPLFDLRNSF